VLTDRSQIVTAEGVPGQVSSLTIATPRPLSPQTEIRGNRVQLKRPIRFLGILALVLSAALLGSAGTAAAANPLLCFSGTTDGATYGGVCTLNAGGTGATLDNTGGDPDGSYSGVYYATSSLSGKLVSSITQLSFDYTGNAATAGSPRISLPIDTTNNGSTDFYAFIGASACGIAGHVDIHNAGCLVFYTGGPVSGETWATFAAHGWSVSGVAGDVPFVIADDAGIWTVSNVQLGQGEAATVATSKDECKKGGWADLTRADGSSFKNQGDCIQYVNTGK